MDKGYLPKIPGFTEFLYCFSTAVLFHAAILEPTNLRPSYWKFLHSISGGRYREFQKIRRSNKINEFQDRLHESGTTGCLGIRDIQVFSKSFRTNQNRTCSSIFMLIYDFVDVGYVFVTIKLNC